MNKKDRIKDIIENKVSFISEIDNTSINTNNGILNKDFLDRRKKALIKRSIEHLADKHVFEFMYYPENDIADVDLTLDIVVIKRAHFDQLKDLINE
jgi:hypothetical protein